ncbi:MAG TPA: ABC transporter permease [Acidimicrobiales bacterium]|nr:ABC transporter permease [Acidimicrobiales bacterium]
MTDGIVLQGAVLQSPAAAAGGTFAKTWSEVRVMATRSSRLSLRAIDGLVWALALPVVLMGLFVYLFGGAIHTGARYVDYVVPGVLVVCIGYSAVMTCASVAHDLNEGMVDRLRSMDVGGASFMAGHVLASVARNLISAVLVLGVAFAMGFRPHASALDWLKALGVLALCVLAYTWVTATLGALARSAEAANGMGFLVRLRRIPQQRLRPGEEHGHLGARLRRPPANYAHREHPARAARRDARHQHRDGRCLVLRNHRRVSRAGRVAVPIQDRRMTPLRPICSRLGLMSPGEPCAPHCRTWCLPWGRSKRGVERADPPLVRARIDLLGREGSRRRPLRHDRACRSGALTSVGLASRQPTSWEPGRRGRK